MGANGIAVYELYNVLQRPKQPSLRQQWVPWQCSQVGLPACVRR